MVLHKEVLIRAANIRWNLFLSITLGAFSGLYLDLGTQSLNTTDPTSKSCRSISCPKNISMGLSSSKVSFHFLTMSPFDVSITPVLLRTAWLSAALTSRNAGGFPEYLRLTNASHLPLPFQTPPSPGLLLRTCREDSFPHRMSTSSFLGCYLGKHWLWPQRVAAVHMTLFLDIWVLFSFLDFWSCLYLLYYSTFNQHFLTICKWRLKKVVVLPIPEV